MNGARTGSLLRQIRQRKRWRQADLARRAGVSRQAVSRIERGWIHNLPFGTLELVAAALDAQVDLVVRWHGGDLSRLVNARHAAMHETVAGLFARLPGWKAEPEVSFSIWGERGVIDVLAWHDGRRALLVVELKSELVDVSELLGTLDRKRRLAARVASERGWLGATTSAWVAIADSRANRRAVAQHGTAIRSKLPIGGRVMKGWLDDPVGAVNALTFLSSAHSVSSRPSLAATRRVNRPRKSAASGSETCR